MIPATATPRAAVCRLAAGLCLVLCALGAPLLLRRLGRSQEGAGTRGLVGTAFQRLQEGAAGLPCCW
eukprot:2842584-Rhodomonas_salina.4